MPFSGGQDFAAGFLGNLGKFKRAILLFGSSAPIACFFKHNHSKQPNGGYSEAAVEFLCTMMTDIVSSIGQNVNGIR